MMKKKRVLISIEPEQIQWVKDHSINLSGFVRKAIEKEKMSYVGEQESKVN